MFFAVADYDGEREVTASTQCLAKKDLLKFRSCASMTVYNLLILHSNQINIQKKGFSEICLPLLLQSLSEKVKYRQTLKC